MELILCLVIDKEDSNGQDETSVKQELNGRPFYLQTNLDLTCLTEMDASMSTKERMSVTEITVSFKAIVKAGLSNDMGRCIL